MDFLSIFFKVALQYWVYFINTPGPVRHLKMSYVLPLRWRHNGCDSVSNHQPHYCLLNRLFRRRKKNIKAPRHWPFFGELGTGGGPVNSPHKWPVTRKMFPFDDVIMRKLILAWWRHKICKRFCYSFFYAVCIIDLCGFILIIYPSKVV